MEQRYRIGTTSGHLMWNVGSMLANLSSFELVSFNVDALSESNPFHGNTDYAMTTDLSKPIIVVELAENKFKVIDGNHRLFKARSRGIETRSAYYLTKAEQIRFIEDYNEETYHEIIRELYADSDI